MTMDAMEVCLPMPSNTLRLMLKSFKLITLTLLAPPGDNERKVMASLDEVQKEECAFPFDSGSQAAGAAEEGVDGAEEFQEEAEEAHAPARAREPG